MSKSKSAAECIATRYGQDIADVREMRYQAGRQSCAVYSMFDGYVCCPPIGAALPRDRDIADRWDWKADGEAFGRTIYFASTGQQA